MLDGIVVNAPRALEEINAEYSTMTEVADFLMQRANVPFRIGHHFAAAQASLESAFAGLAGGNVASR